MSMRFKDHSHWKGQSPWCFTDVRSKPGETDLRQEIIKGLSSRPRELPSLLLWDDEGLRLYERLKTESQEYYVSRKEEDIISQNASEIAAGIPTSGTLLELGSGYDCKDFRDREKLLNR